MSRLDYGTVEITLGGKVYTLEPTLNCSRNLKKFGLGPPRMAAEKCAASLDADDMAIVVCAGANLDRKDIDKIAHAIHGEGVVQVAAPIIDFLAMLLNPTGKTSDQDAELGE